MNLIAAVANSTALLGRKTLVRSHLINRPE
jgi:hypothetical protein